MLVNKTRELFQALQGAGFNQSAAGRLLGVSRETIRLRLIEAGGFPGLITKAAEMGLATKAEAADLAAAVALAPATRQGANQEVGANDESSANQPEIRHLRGSSGAPIFSGIMSTMPQAQIPQSTTVRVTGQERAFGKRVAVELSLKAGLPREDLSVVVTRMIGYFMARGGPDKVAEMLMEDPEEPPAEKPKKARDSK